MESLDLTNKLIALKIKSKTLDRIYFMSQISQEHNHCYDKRKNKKMKITKIYLFLLPHLPSQDGGRLFQPSSPPPPNFFTAKIFEKFFHRYMGIWKKGGQIGRMAILAKTQKWYEGKSERGVLQQPPPEREG